MTMNSNILGTPGRGRLGLAVGIAALSILASWSVVLADEAKPATQASDSLVASAATTQTPATQPSTQVQVPNPFARVIDDPIQFQYFKPHDARALNMFETPKVEGVPYTGNKIDIGVAFTQQFQSLEHQNSAAPNMTVINGQPVNLNQLIEIGSGFNNATANLFLDAQLAKGIRVTLTSYLSSRHHQESWVKDGYLLVDASPIQNKYLDGMMKYATLKAGHFEVNYGDAHFRASDNGNAMFNPFVGNLLMNAFTTEVGAEAYLRNNGYLAMAGITGGEIRGQITRPDDRSPSYLGKLGFDKEVATKTRVRLTGSVYTTEKSVNNTLYSGSRAGSRYYDVLENTQSTETAQAWSGDIQPGLRSKVTAWVVNPFVKWNGVELFGNIEQAKGRAANETNMRTWHQYSGEGLYRFYQEKFYVGGRYNVVDGSFAGMTSDVKVDRTQFAGGWFVTEKILTKVEYVKQNYMDFPTSDIRHGGQFEGWMFEGVVTF
jgi:hypothetical protein